ncbi:cardiolipin synthase [Priestia endophytica]|uniref:cardiolipin synthase n=1 Tax=Priestia endophytica TaxID=135735 RepID=UPI00227DE0A8|nr:cardiolipin synthase [Priestia endophytica]MCY8234515.1 cardiolipin synthase [Priestia endophytica]
MKKIRQFLFFLGMIVSFIVVVATNYSLNIKIVFGLIYIIIVLSICGGIMLENRSPYKTLLWMYAIIFFPLVGYVFFIYSGQLEVKGHLFKRKREKHIEMMKKMIHCRPSELSQGFNEKEKSFADLVETLSQHPLSCYSQTEVLKNGDETFPAIREELRKAREYIHLGYYTLRDDKVGMSIIDILCEKAKNGCEVLVYHDYIGSSLSRRTINKMRECGVRVHGFLPLRRSFFNQKLNFRNHRKIIVIDGKVGFVGGMNIGDEYIGEGKRFSFWRDTHLKVKGEVVQTLQAAFLSDWFYITGEELPFSKYKAKELQNGDGGIQVVTSGPDSSQSVMSDLYHAMVTSAKESIIIATPYFVPNKDIRTALKIAAVRGVDIKIMVPRKNDGFLTQYGTNSYFGEMLNENINIYQYEKGFMHHKILIVDDKIASVGTANVDIRSLQLNFEINVFLLHSKTIQQLIHNFYEDIKDSHKVEKQAYRHRSLLKRLKESFARLFSPVI